MRDVMCHGTVMASPWQHHVTAMALPFFYHGTVMPLPCGTTGHGIAMAIPWHCHGTCHALPWRYIAMVYCQFQFVDSAELVSRRNVTRIKTQLNNLHLNPDNQKVPRNLSAGTRHTHTPKTLGTVCDMPPPPASNARVCDMS